MWNSGIIRHHDDPIKFSISLRNVEKLALITNNGGDNINEDWAMWMDLEVIESEPATRGPVIDNVKVTEFETNIDQDDVKPREKKKKEKKKLKNKVKVSEGIRVENIADTYVYAYSYRNWNDANFGEHDVITTGWVSVGGEKRTYLKIDLPNMDSETIDKVILKLYHHSSIGNNSSTINIHKVLDNWQEGDGILHDGQVEPIDSTGVVTWNMQPSYNDSIITQFTPKRNNKWIEFDITSLFKDWINGEPNYGIL